MSNSIAILQAIAAAPAYYLTAAEGESLLAEGLITVDPAQPNPMNPTAFLVKLTAAGLAAASTVKEKPVVSAIVAGIAIPAKKPRSGNANNLTPRAAVYPFEQLPAPVTDPISGQVQYASFHVAANAGNPEPWKKLASATSAANKRSRQPMLDANNQPVLQSVEVKKVQKDANGKAIVGADGKRLTYVVTEMLPVTSEGKLFAAHRVDATDPNGVGCRVFRIK